MATTVHPLQLPHTNYNTRALPRTMPQVREVLHFTTTEPRQVVQELEKPRHNRTLIRSGEARLFGWSRSTLYSGFNASPRSVVRRQTGFAAQI